MEGGWRAAGEAPCSWLMRESIRLSPSRGSGITAWSGRPSGLGPTGRGPLICDAIDRSVDGELLEAYAKTDDDDDNDADDDHDDDPDDVPLLD